MIHTLIIYKPYISHYIPLYVYVFFAVCCRHILWKPAAGSALVSPALPASLIRYAPEGRTGAFMGSLDRNGWLEKVYYQYYLFIVLFQYYDITQYKT